MSRGLRSGCYDDAAIYYDGDDRTFYAGDTFDRGDTFCFASTANDNTYKSLSANKIVNGTASATCSFDGIYDTVNTIASNSVSVSSSFDELAARITALESVVNKEVNSYKNSFSNAVSGIKRLTRTGLKTLQYGAR